jgi:ketosteroid isomerase-like protein
MTVREAFEKGTARFNAHDLDGFAAVLADDVVFRAPGGIRGIGKTARVAFFGSWLRAFPDGRVDVETVHIVDDIVVEEGRFTGTHNGILPSAAEDIAATGRSVALDYIQVLRFRDGKHVSFNLVFDRLLMLEQLGLVPTPTPAGRK